MSFMRPIKWSTATTFIFSSAALILIPKWPAAAQTNATWNGGGDGTNYNDPANWDIGVVPINGVGNTFIVDIPDNQSVLFNVLGVGHQIFQLSLGSNSTLTVNSGRDLEVVDEASIQGMVITSGGTFLASSITSMFLGNQAQLSASSTGRINVAATSYSATDLAGTFTLFSSDGTGTLLDLSSLQSIDAGWDDINTAIRVNTIRATGGGLLDLSGVTTINAPLRVEDRLDIIAESGSTIDLSSLGAITSAARGQTVLTLGDGAIIKLGSLVKSDNTKIQLNDLNSILEVTGSLVLNSGTLSVETGATVKIGGNFSFAYTNESDFVANSGVFQLQGTGAQQFEVGGEDLGVNGTTSGNFGIGQMVLGTTKQRTSVDLIDVVDNGNRGSGGKPESLTLYGLGGPAGLRILNQSALILNGINVYAWDPLVGEQVHLNSLFQSGELRIPFDDGFLQLVPLDFSWVNNTGGDFNLEGNWSDKLVPLGSDVAIWNLGSVDGYTVQFGTNVATDSAIIKTDRLTYDLGGFQYSLAASHATTGLEVGQDSIDNAMLTIRGGTLASQDVRVAASAGSQGLLIIDPTGILKVSKNLALGGGDGTLRLRKGSQAIVGGSLRIAAGGRLEGSGIVAGSVENQAGLIGPGDVVGTLQIAGSLVQQPAATLVIELGGTDNSNPLNPEFDQLVVNGPATLDGKLKVTLVDLGAGPYSPDVEDEFVFFITSGKIAGQLRTFDMPELIDLTWLLQGTTNLLTLSLTDNPADFDGDQDVDGADFLIWQRGSGILTGAALSDGDANGDGAVDDQDLALWDAQSGRRVVGGPLSSLVTIPEPSSSLLLWLCLPLAYRSRQLLQRNP